MDNGYIVLAFRPQECESTGGSVVVPFGMPVLVQRATRLDVAVVLAYAKAASDRLVTFIGQSQFVEVVDGKPSFTREFWQNVFHFRPKTLYATTNGEIQDDVEMLIDQSVSVVLEELLGVKVSS